MKLATFPRTSPRTLLSRSWQLHAKTYWNWIRSCWRLRSYKHSIDETRHAASLQHVIVVRASWVQWMVRQLWNIGRFRVWRFPGC